MTPTPTVLLLPGWLDSGPGHWQTIWEAGSGFVRVKQHDWVWPRRGDWMARLEETVLDTPGPLRIAAHSLGCHLAAAWAAHSAHRDRIQAALLVAPPDLARADLPPQLAAWPPPVQAPLPFPALVVGSGDDPFSSIDATERLARDWGAALWRLDGAGHINADSSLGAWPEGLARLRALGSCPR